MKRLRDDADLGADIDVSREEIDVWDEVFHHSEQYSAESSTESSESSDRTVEYVIANDISDDTDKSRSSIESEVTPTVKTSSHAVDQIQSNMEDMLGLMGTLSPEELYPLCVTYKRRLDTQYLECCIAVTQRFLYQCRDVIVDNVLGALAYTEELRYMLTMRTVSKAWCAMVSDVSHVRVQYEKKAVRPTNWVKQINNYYHQFNDPLNDTILNNDDEKSFSIIKCHAYLLNELFPRATSIECSLWLICVPPHMLELGRVTSLKVMPDMESATKLRLGVTTYTPSLTDWCHLDTLILPAVGGQKIPGLETLIRLTRLQALSGSMVTDVVVGALTNLAHLTLYNASARLDLASLKQLTFLESDQPAHFAGFTGHGILQANLNQQLGKRLPEHCARQEDFDRYELGCFALSCHGSWSNGRYSGPLDMSYECKDSPSRVEEAITGWVKAPVTHNFTGYMVDGQLWGVGQEYMDQEQLYEGEWVQGRRHGAGKLTKRVYKVKLDHSHDRRKSQWAMDWVLYAEQEWEQGRLVKEKVVGNPALFI